MSFRGKNAAANTVQVWNGTRWVPLSNLAFTESGANSTVTNASGSLTIAATTGPLSLTTAGAASLDSTGNTLALSGNTSAALSSAAGPVTVTGQTNVSLTATTGTASLTGQTSATLSAVAGTVTVSGTAAAVTATTGNVTLSANSGNGDFSVSAKNTILSGNLIVNGTTTSIDTQTVLIKDNYIEVNSTNTSLTAVPGGMVVNLLASATPTSITSFTATTISAAGMTLVAGDFIAVIGSTIAENNGLFQVLTYADPVITINTGSAEGFAQTTLTAGAGSGTVNKAQVSGIRSGTDGAWEQATGTTAPLTWQDFSVGNETLQQAYSNGSPSVAGTIALTAALGPMVFRNGTESVDPLHLQVGAGNTDILVASSAGAITVTPVSGQNFAVTVAGAGVASLTSASTALSVGTTLTLNGGGGVDTWPATQGTSGQVLSTTGSGALTWTTPAGVSLQDAYDGGNTIAVAGILPVDISTALATNALNVSSSGTGTALAVSSSGAGSALTVDSTVLVVDSAGAVSSSPTSGQDFSVTTAGAGDIVLSASGTGAVSLTSTGGGATVSGATLDVKGGGTNADRWPTTNGAVGQVLTVSATGSPNTLSWTTPAASNAPYLIQSQGTTTTITNAAINANEITVACTAGGITINIPDPTTVTSGKRLVIKDATGNAGGAPANQITITSALAGSIDGATSQFIGTDYGSVTLQADTAGSRWLII
jgi:hypothetical protein